MAKSRALDPPELTIRLRAPGMTSLLRSGLGGLASSLYCLWHTLGGRGRWNGHVALSRGQAEVRMTEVILRPGKSGWEPFLRELFESCFRLRKPPGLIEPLSWIDPRHPCDDITLAQLQTGLERTLLQYGRFRKKAAKAQTLSIEIDDHPVPFPVQPYRWYVHQDAWHDVLRALRRGTAMVASWAMPGAIVRHVAFSARSGLSYSPAELLSACFTLCGCLCYSLTDGRAGVLVVLDPSDLVRFAQTRPKLTPRRPSDAYVTGPADAVLSCHLALRLEKIAREESGIAGAHAIAFRPTDWSPQQKSRVSILWPLEIEEATLDLFQKVASALPTRLRESQTSQGLWVQASALRPFLADNIARGQPWYRGFATARDAEARSLCCYSNGTNNGALRRWEQEGLVSMTEHLGDAERALVESVHLALRQRFGAIAEATRDNPVTMNNRFEAERERWRLRFAGAKTQPLVREALSDLWSRAGTNRVLQDRWPDILTLLSSSRWPEARDLALVALASYRSEKGESEPPEPPGAAE